MPTARLRYRAGRRRHARDAEHAGHGTLEFHRVAVAWFRWCVDNDALDEGACGFEHCGGLSVGDRALEVSDTLAVEGRDVGREHRAGRCWCADLGLEFRASRLKLVELLPDAGVAQAVCDGPDQVLQLSLGSRQLAPGRLGADVGFTLQALPLGVEGLDEPLHCLRCHEIAPQGGQHPAFELTAPERASVVAGALEGVVACQVVLAPDGERATAASAEHLVREEVAGAAAIPETLRGHGAVGGDLLFGWFHSLGCEALLDRVPKWLIDDAQVGHLDFDERLGGVGTSNCLPGLGVQQRAHAVPDEPAGVEAVAQETLATLGAAANGGVVPQAASGPRNALRIEGARDGQRARTGGVVAEDALHDHRFVLVDLAQATLRLAVRAQPADHTIAIGRPGDAAPLQDAPCFAPAGLVGQVLEVEGAHGALEADVELADVPFGQSDDTHIGEDGGLVEGGDVLLVAREAVEALGQHHVETALGQAPEQRLVAWALRGRTRDRGVSIGRDDRPAFPVGTLLAQAQLVLDGGRTLGVGGVARVEGDAQGHEASPGVGGDVSADVPAGVAAGAATAGWQYRSCQVAGRRRGRCRSR